MNQKLDDTKPVTQKVLMDTLLDFYEQVLDPQFERKADKENIRKLQVKVDSGFRDISRRLTDQELDTPTKDEFKRLEKRVDRIERQLQN